MFKIILIIVLATLLVYAFTFICDLFNPKKSYYEELSEKLDMPKNIRFTADRKDPDGYERHKGVGAVSTEKLRDMLKKEGFCEERINRLIRDTKFIICYDSFLI